jgi:hypothetical protein
MTLSGSPRVLIAILAAACLTCVAMFDWPLLPLLNSTPYDQAVEWYCRVDHWRSDPTIAARTFSISLFFLAPIAAAVFTAFSVVRSKVWLGALAAGVSQVIAYAALSTWHAGFCNSWRELTDGIVLVLVTIAFFSLLGALGAWLALRWRSNTSLERTREG